MNPELRWLLYDSRSSVALCIVGVPLLRNVEISLSVHVDGPVKSLLKNIWKTIAKVGVGKRKLLSVDFLPQLLTTSFQVRNMLGCLC
jgi:hypothetical protein